MSHKTWFFLFHYSLWRPSGGIYSWMAVFEIEASNLQHSNTPPPNTEKDQTWVPILWAHKEDSCILHFFQWWQGKAFKETATSLNAFSKLHCCHPSTTWISKWTKAFKEITFFKYFLQAVPSWCSSVNEQRQKLLSSNVVYSLSPDTWINNNHVVTSELLFEFAFWDTCGLCLKSKSGSVARRFDFWGKKLRE